MKMNMVRWSSLLLVTSSVVVGCSDSIVAPASDPSSSPLYSAAYVDETALADYSEMPSTDEALYSVVTDPADSSDADSTRPPHHDRDGRRGHHDEGREWHERGRGRDFGPIGFHDYRRVVARLKLSAEQDSLFRTYIADLRACAQDAAARYKEARKAAFDTMKTNVDSVRAALAAGTITETDARAAIVSILAEYRATVEPLNAQLRSAVDLCRTTFESSFEAILTAEQLAIWSTMKR
jgi:uncharacterized membrane protein